MRGLLNDDLVHSHAPAPDAAADGELPLEHRYVQPIARKQPRRGQPRRPGSDDGNVHLYDFSEVPCEALDDQRRNPGFTQGFVGHVPISSSLSYWRRTSATAPVVGPPNRSSTPARPDSTSHSPGGASHLELPTSAGRAGIPPADTRHEPIPTAARDHCARYGASSTAFTSSSVSKGVYASPAASKSAASAALAKTMSACREAHRSEWPSPM